VNENGRDDNVILIDLPIQRHKSFILTLFFVKYKTENDAVKIAAEEPTFQALHRHYLYRIACRLRLNEVKKKTWGGIKITSPLFQQQKYNILPSYQSSRKKSEGEKKKDQEFKDIMLSGRTLFT